MGSGTPSGEGSGDSGRDWAPPVRSMRNGALPPARAHELHNVRLFTQLNGGVAPTQAVEEVGHGVEILLRVYGRCLKGQDQIADRRIVAAWFRIDDLLRTLAHAYERVSSSGTGLALLGLPPESFSGVGPDLRRGSPPV